MGATRIRSVALRPHDPRLDGPKAGPEERIDVVVDIPAGDLRARWEADVLAVLFGRQSRVAGLPMVSILDTGSGSWRVEHAVAEPAPPPLSAADIADFRTAATAAAQGAELVEFEVLEPHGHAVAMAVAVDEPHAFLRQVWPGFVSVVAPWGRRTDGTHIEIRDELVEPVLRVSWHAGGGGVMGRGDVSCCLGGSRGLFTAPPRRCPVFGLNACPCAS